MTVAKPRPRSAMPSLQGINILLLFIVSLASITVVSAEETIADRVKYGRLVGDIMNTKFGVDGTVYAVDQSKLNIKGFSYDDNGVDAFFYIKNKGQQEMKLIPYPAGGGEHLGKYANQDIALQLPTGQKVSQIDTLYVRSRTNTGDEDIYGQITFGSDLSIPKEREIEKITELKHEVKSGKIIIKDAKTLFIPKFHYDGKAPQAYFFVGNGTSRKNPVTKIPDERGSYEPVKRKYNGVDITLKLPGDLNVYNIEWVSMWCVDFSKEFGHFDIPRPEDLNVPPYIGEEIAGPPKKSLQITVENSGANFLSYSAVLSALTISFVAYFNY